MIRVAIILLRSRRISTAGAQTAGTNSCPTRFRSPSTNTWVLLTIVLLLITPIAAAACEDCRWTPPPGTMLLGEGLELTVSRPLDERGRRLPTLSLDALDDDFELLERIAGAGAESEDMRLLLYPRRTGRLPLTLPGLGTRFIDVRDDGPVGVSFSWHAEPRDWTLRRSTRLTLEACTRGALRWQRPEPMFSTGLSLVPLPSDPAADVTDPRGCIPQRWSWSATPTLGGALRLDFGMLEANRHGTRLRFPTPAFETRIASIPAWLPAGIAIDAPEVIEDARPADGRVGQPMVWLLRIRADYSEATLRALLDAQRVGSGPWARYPLQISATRDAAPSPLWEIRLTAQPEKQGALALPALSLPWFDTATDALRQTRITPGSMVVRDPARETLGRVLWLTAAALLLALVVRGARHALRDWLLHHRLIARVAHAANAHALHAALVGTSRPQTTAQWLQGFQQTRTAATLPAVLDTLDALRFGKHGSEDFHRVRAQLVQCLRTSRRRPRPRWRAQAAAGTGLRMPANFRKTKT